MTIELRTRRYDETHETHGAALSADTTQASAEKDAKKVGDRSHAGPDWLPAPIGHVVSKIESARTETVKSASDAIRKAIREAASKGAEGMKMTPEERARIGKDLADLAGKIDKLEKQLKAAESSNPFYKELNEAIHAMHTMHAGLEAFAETHGHPLGAVALVAGGIKLYRAVQGMLSNAKAAGQLEPAKVWEPILKDAGEVIDAFQKLSNDVEDIAFAKPPVRVAG
jgi:Arc/MetJ-type ribon-helix-helix transcriptional regulator